MAKPLDLRRPGEQISGANSQKNPFSGSLAVLDLHCGRTPCYVLGNQTSAPTPLAKGVSQGDPTSAWLFQISLEFLLRSALRQMQPVAPVPEGVCIHALYMDDLLILGQSAAALQTAYAGIAASLQDGGLHHLSEVEQFVGFWVGRHSEQNSEQTSCASCQTKTQKFCDKTVRI